MGQLSRREGSLGHRDTSGKAKAAAMQQSSAKAQRAALEGEIKEWLYCESRWGRIFHHKALKPIGQSPSNAIPETISKVSHARWYEEMSFLTCCLSLFLEPGTSDTKVIKWGPFVI